MLQAGYNYAKVLDAESILEANIRVRKVKRTLKTVNCRRGLLVKCTVLIFAFALLVVYLCIKTSTLGYQIVSLEKDINNLETANQRMAYEIAEKSSLQRIEQIATSKLGMNKPEMDGAFTVMVPPKDVQQVKLAREEQSKTTDLPGQKSLQKIYASLTRLAARTN